MENIQKSDNEHEIRDRNFKSISDLNSIMLSSFSNSLWKTRLETTSTYVTFFLCLNEIAKNEFNNQFPLKDIKQSTATCDLL